MYRAHYSKQITISEAKLAFNPTTRVAIITGKNTEVVIRNSAATDSKLTQVTRMFSESINIFECIR